ncbi:MAG: ATP synthase F0 subunit B [Candidatus Solibacter usitatus]|nr:ATP synthase F0 subunit B [Candidatus Solibacter usitatus]
MKPFAGLLIAVLLLGSSLYSQEHAATAEQHGTAAESPEPDLTLWKWANFALLAGALGFLIVKNAGPFFASRSAEIRRGLEEARQARADAEARSAQIEKMMANLGAEIEALRGAAHNEAAAEGERIRQETARELAKIQAQADQDLASALKAAQADLKRHAARLAIELARQKIQQRLTPGDQDALVRAFASGIKPVE